MDVEKGGGLVLVRGGVDSNAHHGTPTESQPEEDKHKAPTSTPRRPLSLQEAWAASVPPDKMVAFVHPSSSGPMHITLFGRQNSFRKEGRKGEGGWRTKSMVELSDQQQYEILCLLDRCDQSSPHERLVYTMKKVVGISEIRIELNI